MRKYKFDTYGTCGEDEFTAADDVAAIEWAKYRAQVRSEGPLKCVHRLDRNDDVGDVWTPIYDSPKGQTEQPPAHDPMSIQIGGQQLDTYTRTLAALAMQNGGVVKVPASMVEQATGLVMYHDGEYIVIQGFRN